MGETNEKECDPVSYYIKKIRRSNAHDDVSTELYWALECKGDPPYSKWVATWILKCIRECFENKIEADILLASFALLPGYYLAGHTLRDRLWQYIDDSDYLTIYPSESGRRIEDIHDKKEINKIEEKIQKKERACVEELIVYIKDIINPATHIEELNEYGHKEMLSNKKIAFKPDPEHIKLSYPKQKDNNLQPIGDTDPHSKSGQDEDTSFPEDSVEEEATARIALRQDNQTIETLQSGNIESENTIGNGAPLVPQRDINAIKQYIKAIQTSSDYDEYGDELYEALCGSGNPPYSKWVATWLIKCIRERFGESTDANILYASFALFKGYELGMMDINARLNKYCRESNYLDNSSYFFEKLIKRSNLKKKLREYEQRLTNSLIEYIMGIPTPKEHVASLNGFGEKIMIPNERIYYKPIRPEIKYTDKLKPSFNIKQFICVVIVMVIIVIVLLIAIPNYITINNNTINSSPDRKPYIQAALPMVESLQATKDTIYIKAGERRLLSVDVEPNDAAKFLYYAYDEKYLVVVSDDGVIQAATDWSEDTVPEADIYIHAKNKIAKIHVIVYK